MSSYAGIIQIRSTGVISGLFKATPGRFPAYLDCRTLSRRLLNLPFWVSSIRVARTRVFTPNVLFSVRNPYVIRFEQPGCVFLFIVS